MGRLAGPVCVYMCVSVRDTVCSRSPATSRSALLPQPWSAPWLTQSLGCGFQLHCLERWGGVWG